MAWCCSSVDFAPYEHSDVHYQMNPQHSWKEQHNLVVSSLANDKAQFNAVVNVAGSWAGGSAADDNMVDTVESLFKSNVQSAFSGGVGA